ncbi:MAG: hypothetical protein KKB25_00090 [Nanoarchaeota archaeon]|nr:hypothetical protein [Nanoarchaeota archaeon]
MNKSSEEELKKHFETLHIKNVKHLLNKNKAIPTLRFVAEHTETVGNHCLAILKMFELTQDKEFIKLGMIFLEKTAKKNGKAYFWGFGGAVADIPPDADDTAIALLVFLLAKKLKIEYPKKFLNKKSFEQFDSLISERGGVFTYFGKPRRNDVDAIANTIVAFLLEFSNKRTKARPSIRKYLNDYFERKMVFHSEYYKHEEYFLLRCAKLAACFPDYFSSEARKELERQIMSFKEKGRIKNIFIESAKTILKISKNHSYIPQTLGLVFPELLYIQRTPFYEYGSQLENRLFEAELKELKKKTPKHYVIELSEIPRA